MSDWEQDPWVVVETFEGSGRYLAMSEFAAKECYQNSFIVTETMEDVEAITLSLEMNAVSEVMDE